MQPTRIDGATLRGREDRLPSFYKWSDFFCDGFSLPVVRILRTQPPPSGIRRAPGAGECGKNVYKLQKISHKKFLTTYDSMPDDSHSLQALLCRIPLFSFSPIPPAPSYPPLR